MRREGGIFNAQNEGILQCLHAVHFLAAFSFREQLNTIIIGVSPIAVITAQRANTRPNVHISMC